LLWHVNNSYQGNTKKSKNGVNELENQVEETPSGKTIYNSCSSACVDLDGKPPRSSVVFSGPGRL